MSTARPSPAANARAPLSLADARALIGELDRSVEVLTSVIEQESGLVRSGRLTEAAKLASQKSAAAGVYLAGAQRLKDHLPGLRTELAGVLVGMKDRHAAFQALLQRNLTVLATAQAVSEGIMRGVAAEVTKSAAPSTYGASGRAAAADPRHARPMALSRAL